MQDCTYHGTRSVIAAPPASAGNRCPFCNAKQFKAGGPCAVCGVWGYKSGEPPAFRKTPRTRYDDPPELLPTEPTWTDLEEVTAELF
jgi:hypothetical protein